MDDHKKLIEQAANIIDPWAFGVVANIMHSEVATVHRNQAQAKAEAIHALYATALEGLVGEMDARGWLYISDDGPEWSADHPVESGQVPDARKVRPATADALLDQLKDAWGGYHDSLASEARMGRRMAEAEARATAAEASLKELREALRPFAEKLVDIGEDEADDDAFRDMSPEHRRAPRINVGHLRRAAAALSPPDTAATVSSRSLGEGGFSSSVAESAGADLRSSASDSACQSELAAAKREIAKLRRIMSTPTSEA